MKKLAIALALTFALLLIGCEKEFNIENCLICEQYVWGLTDTTGDGFGDTIGWHKVGDNIYCDGAPEAIDDVKYICEQIEIK